VFNPNPAPKVLKLQSGERLRRISGETAKMPEGAQIGIPYRDNSRVLPTGVRDDRHLRPRGGTPAGREPTRWKLLTDLPVDDLPSAIEKLDWYAMRWKTRPFTRF
jgi:hypothetical protein